MRVPSAVMMAVLGLGCTETRSLDVPASPGLADTQAVDEGGVEPADTPGSEANGGVVEAHGDDPCVLRARVPLRLRGTTRAGHTVVTARLPAGTVLEFLAAYDRTRGPLDRLGVYTRVRVPARALEGFVFADAREVRRCQDSRSPSPDVREQRTVVVDGVEEVWRVRFVTPSGAPQPIDDAVIDCATGYEASRDRGDVVIERLRNGVVIDTLASIPPLEDGLSTRWPMRFPWRVYGWHALRHPAQTIAHLPYETVLDLGDYDHDGRATEFALDGGHVCCGHVASAVVGLTRSRPRLHVLRWANGDDWAQPNGRLAWEAVRAHPRGELVTWRCGDHGFGDEERLRWWPARGGLAHAEIARPMTEDCRPIATTGAEAE